MIKKIQKKIKILFFIPRVDSYDKFEFKRIMLGKCYKIFIINFQWQSVRQTDLTLCIKRASLENARPLENRSDNV